MKFQIKKNIIGVCIILVFAFTNIMGQSSDIVIDNSYNNLQWQDFVKKAEQNHNIHFYFQDSLLSSIIIKVDENKSLFSVLRENLNTVKISFLIYGNDVFVTSGGKIKTTLPDNFFEIRERSNSDLFNDQKKESNIHQYLSTRKALLTKNIVVGDRKQGAGKNIVTVDGFIKSTDDGLPIIGASLYLEELETGTTTNDIGYFSISLKKGKYSLKVNSIESNEEQYELDVLSDGRVDLYLDKKVYALNEVIIRSDKEDNIRGTQMGFDKLSAKSIKEIPAIMGERDIVKVALLLPGVQSVGEGASGYNVRGSPADQNVFYLNNVPIYNTSHLFGFFSAFTPDAISDFKLYKSNIPAKYGGRLSSIFDITAKEGNKKRFSLRGGISPITGSFMVEGPFMKDKSSYLVAVRSTYSNWILGMIDNYEIKNSNASFADAITNFSISLNSNNQIKLLTYFSYDDISLVSQTDYAYQNMGASLGWNHIIKSKHNLQLTYSFSNYGFNEENSQLEWAAYKNNYNLQHNEIKANVTLRPNEKHSISFGANTILYNLDRGDHLPLNEFSDVVPVYLGKEKGIEGGLFIDEEWTVSPVFSLSGGFRYNFYTYLGANDVYEYFPGAPLEIENITDTVFYKNNEIIKTYTGPDFRLAANYIVNPNLSIKAGFSQLHQYIFMLSNTIAMSPTDKWKLSDSHIKPMRGQQYSLGIFTNFLNSALEFSAEVYYKKVKNLVEYKDGADLLVTKVVETEVLQGDLDAYGLELMLKKPYGRLNGWLNYTYSSSTVLVKGNDEFTSINFGNPYPANYDKPHALNLVLNYKLSRRLSFSSNVVYSTGRPITYPTAIFYQDGSQITYYSSRNEYRIPDYFRLDLAVNLEGNLKKHKLIHGSWSLSVYNVTGRRNAYSVYFKSEQGTIKGYKLSIFGSPIVSLSYNFKLGNYEN